MFDRLRNAVKKVKFLLNLNLHRWRLASILSNKASSSRRRTLSLNDRRPGLRAYADDIYYRNIETSVAPTSDRRLSTCSSSRRIERTISCSSEDDIDKKAELFINNFKRQLLMERQVSLQLRYSRGNSFDQ
ncbi:hypothetical protein POM88_010656 [Heracleum sosnowskyi]|uniref:DUF761 domain-containing protein n=1 Tax=Heracleum sosnowskyi TaxID=360622 RepID=A0AAD8IWW6_9APIA|nr:hypothetical protein POM88_010656 [Heracleum sosnowskyi]